MSIVSAIKLIWVSIFHFIYGLLPLDSNLKKIAKWCFV